MLDYVAKNLADETPSPLDGILRFVHGTSSKAAHVEGERATLS